MDPNSASTSKEDLKETETSTTTTAPFADNPSLEYWRMLIPNLYQIRANFYLEREDCEKSKSKPEPEDETPASKPRPPVNYKRTKNVKVRKRRKTRNVKGSYVQSLRRSKNFANTARIRNARLNKGNLSQVNRVTESENTPNRDSFVSVIPIHQLIPETDYTLGIKDQPTYEPDSATSFTAPNYSPEQFSVSPGSPIHILRPNVSPLPLYDQDLTASYQQNPFGESLFQPMSYARDFDSEQRVQQEQLQDQQILFPLPTTEQFPIHPALQLPLRVLQEMPPSPDLYHQLPPPPLSPSMSQGQASHQPRRKKKKKKKKKKKSKRMNQQLNPQQPSWFDPRERGGGYWESISDQGIQGGSQDFIRPRPSTVDPLTYNLETGWIRRSFESQIEKRDFD